MPNDDAEGQCFLAVEDDPSMLAPPIDHPAGPGWWEGRWPHEGVKSLADLERWVEERCEEVISMRRSCSNALGAIALKIGSQTVENATRYLARFGDGNHPPRPKAEQLQDFAGVQDALEALHRHIARAHATTEGKLPEPNTFLIDHGTFCVRWQGMACILGNTKPFKLLCRLANRPGVFASVDSLINDVWLDEETNVATVQKTVSNLRKKLKDAGMGDLIVAEPNHYALRLPTGTSAVKGT